LRGWCEVAPKAAVVDCQGAARNPEVAHREYAARAAGALAYEDAQRILTPLLKDVEPRVRCAALQSLAGFDDAIEDLGLALSAYLEDADLAVRGTALALLEEPHPAIDLTAIAAAFDASPSSEEAELRVAAVHAAAALTQTERGDGIVGFLKRALQDSSPAVGEAAADVLEQLTGSRPKLPALVTLPSSVGLAPQELNPQPTRNVILHTTRGEIELELFAAEAPRHVKSFLEQAQAGTYDGLTFHRIVTGFVVQGLDPRGDGWGTGDVFLRDEIQSTPYLAGTLGMPNAGPDTGGCQVFMTHVPTPHLDGRYTVFGRVVNGMTVLDSLDLDDRCERVEILRRS
jgi:cyclophilin family peptidyl-prolyl cis-trans isomerase